jgi:DNA-binding MarR family transcriptional regulator
VAGSARRFASSPTLSTVLSLSGRLVQERIGHDLEPLGLSYAQAAVLVRLWRHDGAMPQAEMIDSLALSRASGTNVLNELDRQGLIERAADPADARRMVVRLTEAGHELERPVLDVFERVESEIGDSLGGEDAATAYRVVRAVLEALRHSRPR